MSSFSGHLQAGGGVESLHWNHVVEDVAPQIDASAILCACLSYSASPRQRQVLGTCWLSEREDVVSQRGWEGCVPHAGVVSGRGHHPLRACWGHSVIAVVKNERPPARTPRLSETHCGQGVGWVSLPPAEKCCHWEEDQARTRIAYCCAVGAAHCGQAGDTG